MQRFHPISAPYRKTPCGPDQRGFTLLEMLLVLMIVGIIAASLGTLFVQVISDFIQGREMADRQSQACLATERLVRDVRAAASQNIANNGARLNLIDVESENITYRIDPADGALKISADDGPEHVLARHVHESSFFDIKAQADGLDYPVVILHLRIEISADSRMAFSAAAIPRSRL